ncbi:MAG: hypothetical protein V3S20_08785 [Dehalococcoidia bacterium]
MAQRLQKGGARSSPRLQLSANPRCASSSRRASRSFAVSSRMTSGGRGAASLLRRSGRSFIDWISTNRYFVTKRPIGLVSYDARAIDAKTDALVEALSVFPRRPRLRGQGQPFE